MPNPASAQGTWEVVYDELYGILEDIHFIDEFEGWVVDSHFDDVGRIYHTTDGGFSWDLQDDPVIEGLYCVFFLNSEIGWVGGQDGLIMHTNNGGDTWTEQQTPTIYHVYRIFFIDENIGWAVGGSQAVVTHSFILGTRDGGETWEEQLFTFATVPGVFRCIAFADYNIGLAGGRLNQIYRTDNGGDDWESIPLDSIKTVHGLSYLGNGEFCGVGNDDSIYDLGFPGSVKTWDYGHNWYYTEFDSVEDELLLDVSFADSVNGLAVGYNGTNYYTTDGGNLWQWMEPLPESSLWTVSFPKPYVGWTNSGYGGKIYRYLDDNITPPDNIEDLNILVVEDGIQLSWSPITEDIFGNPINITDLQYEIYGDDEPYFTPGLSNLQAVVADTSFTDMGAVLIGRWYYIIKSVR